VLRLTRQDNAQQQYRMDMTVACGTYAGIVYVAVRNFCIARG
jgi:hypothetical protein